MEPFVAYRASLGVRSSVAADVGVADAHGVLIPYADIECCQAAIAVQRPSSAAAIAARPLPQASAIGLVIDGQLLTFLHSSCVMKRTPSLVRRFGCGEWLR